MSSFYCNDLLPHLCVFFFNETATTEIYTYGHPLSLHDALPIYPADPLDRAQRQPRRLHLARAQTLQPPRADLVLLLCRGAVLCRFGQRLAETRRAAAVADRGTAGAADHLFRLGALSLSGRGDRRISEAALCHQCAVQIGSAHV